MRSDQRGKRKQAGTKVSLGRSRTRKAGARASSQLFAYSRTKQLTTGEEEVSLSVISTVDAAGDG